MHIRLLVHDHHAFYNIEIKRTATNCRAFPGHDLGWCDSERCRDGDGDGGGVPARGACASNALMWC